MTTPASKKPAGLPASGFVVGEPFPLFKIPALDGDPRSLAAYRGKKTIVHIFASW